MAVVSATSNGSFLTTKNGNFYLHTDKELANPFRAVTGKVTSMRYRTETYNGAEQEKFYVSLSDETGTYQLGFNVDSANYGKILGFLKSANLAQPLEISVSGEPNPKDATKTLHNFFVKQNGVSMKSAYPKGSLPAWKEFMISGKKVFDKAEYWAELKRVVEQELIPQFGEATAPQQTASGVNNSTESQDPLPF